LEQARAALARGVDEQVARLRAEAEEICRRAEQRIAEAEARLTRSDRRQELKLARQERDRRVAAAERSLVEQSGELMARIERSGRNAEERVRAACAEAERELAAVTSSTRQVEARMHRLLDTGGSLSELMEQVTAAAEGEGRRGTRDRGRASRAGVRAVAPALKAGAEGPPGGLADSASCGFGARKGGGDDRPGA
jgi:chromosome segregation ATPase